MTAPEEDEEETGDLMAPLEGRHSTIYMLRTAQQHQVHLSAMADQKANFLIAGSFVTLSVIASTSRDNLSLALLVMAGFTVSAALCAILAVMPRYRNMGKNMPERNLLFFGGFGDLSKEDYLEKMEPLLHSDRAAYRALLEDIYGLGAVLFRKKYKLLGLSYRIFLVGMFATVITWILERYVIP